MMALTAMSHAWHYSRNMLLISYPDLRFARPWTTTRNSTRIAWERHRKFHPIHKLRKGETGLMINLTIHS